jgi:hypothetical protein
VQFLAGADKDKEAVGRDCLGGDYEDGVIVREIELYGLGTARRRVVLLFQEEAEGGKGAEDLL